jgi:hypothetical protein
MYLGVVIGLDMADLKYIFEWLVAFCDHGIYEFHNMEFIYSSSDVCDSMFLRCKV